MTLRHDEIQPAEIQYLRQRIGSRLEMQPIFSCLFHSSLPTCEVPVPKGFRFGAQTQKGSHPLPNATDESVSKGEKLFFGSVP